MGSSAILLDLDGTLVDSTYHHAVAWQRAFRRSGVRVPMWRTHRAIGMGGDRLVAEVAGREVEDRQGDEVREHWRKEYAVIQDDVTELPHAGEFVRSLSRGKHRLALASSGDPQFTDHAVGLLGIARLVELVTSSADVDSSKPAADLLHTTLERMGGVRSAVLVGDTPYDVEAAARAGLKCVCVRTGGFSKAELNDAGAALVVDSVADLIDLDWDPNLREPSAG